MPEKVNHQEYEKLGRDDDWVKYLQKRLPYSFKNIRPEKGKNSRFVLSEPKMLGSDYHNFWRRGYAFYVIGKLADKDNMHQLWIAYRRLIVERVKLRGNVGFQDPREIYNCMQMEKLWAQVSSNHLDRERVVMTNICQAIELCLKAIKTHAEYRENNRFMFENGHDPKTIFESLPSSLQDTLKHEAKDFARKYTEYRRALEKEITIDPFINISALNWEEIGKRIESIPYTAILGANDPQKVPVDWFEKAIGNIGGSPEHRYSPYESCDPYPVDKIHNGLMLARFLYEHLFPISSESPGRNTVARLEWIDQVKIAIEKKNGLGSPGKFFP